MVLLVEDSPAEATLACAALALRCAAEVLAVRDIPAALDILGRRGNGHSPVQIAILGREAIAGQVGKLVQALSAAGGGVPVVGIADGLGQTERTRALGTGVRALYDRPGEWRAYSALMGRVLSEWGVARSDA